MSPPDFGMPSRPMRITRRATEDAYIIEIALNGLSPKDVKVDVRGNWVIVSQDQSRQEERENNFDEGHGYMRSYSFSSGRSSRRFRLPHDADAQAMSREETKTGILIRIPRERY